MTRSEGQELERREPEGEVLEAAGGLEATGEEEAKGWWEGVGEPEPRRQLEVEPRRRVGPTSRDANVEGLARGQARETRRHDCTGEARDDEGERCAR